MERKYIILILAVVTLAMVFYYQYILHSMKFTLTSVILILVLSVFLVAVASYICGLVGSSNSPVSGMTICALLATALIFYIMGLTGTFAITATLLVSGVICCATCTSGDISQDLKTGLIVGATPRKQQWAEIIGAVIPAFVFAPILVLLHNAYGIGTNAPGSLKAPQAALFASLTESIFGDKEMPWSMVIIGIVLAIIIVVMDEQLAKKEASFRLYPMPVAVGIYLPFSLAIPIVAGGILELFLRDRFKNKPDISEKSTQKIVLLSSGLIAGEAMMGIIIALVIWAIGMFKFGFELPIQLNLPAILTTILSLAALVFILFLIFRKGTEDHY